MSEPVSKITMSREVATAYVTARKGFWANGVDSPAYFERSCDILCDAGISMVDRAFIEDFVDALINRGIRNGSTRTIVNLLYLIEIEVTD